MKRLWVILLLISLSLFGCSTRQTPVANPPLPTSEATQPEIVVPTPVPTPSTKLVKVTLYYPDNQAMYLFKVTREIAVVDGAIVRAIIGELQKGSSGSGPTIPKEAKLLSAVVKDNVAYLNFSQEFRTKHWGGTSGENETLFSIVNSLTELPNIKSVQFYLEGKVEESILGHADWRYPFVRNEQIIKK